jgi:hypothetical protein
MLWKRGACPFLDHEILAGIRPFGFHDFSMSPQLILKTGGVLADLSSTAMKKQNSHTN